MGSRPSNPPPRQCLLTVLDKSELIVASILYFRKRRVEFRNPIKIFRAGLSGRGSVFNRRAHQSHSRGLRRNTVVWKVYAGFGRKAPHSRPESNETTIPDNPPRILLLFRHYPVTIWRRRSESNRFWCFGRTSPFNHNFRNHRPVA